MHVDETQSALQSVYLACTVRRSCNILNRSGPAATAWTKNLCQEMCLGAVEENFMPSAPKVTVELVTFPFGLEPPVTNFYQEIGGSDGFSVSPRSVHLIS